MKLVYPEGFRSGSTKRTAHNVVSVFVIFLALVTPLTCLAQTIKGTAVYRERMLLPPGAVFEATLQDVSRAAAPVEILGKVRIESPTPSPIHFTISYDSSKVQGSNFYAVRAGITGDGKLLFTTDQSYPVLTHGQGAEVELLLKMVSQQASKPAAADGKPVGLGGLPATFTAEMPCADCPGILYQLDLLSDHAFYSRMTYKERSSSFDEIGSWSVANDKRTLILQNNRGTTRKFVIKDADTLRPLNAEGQELPEKYNPDLRRAGTFSPLESKVKVRGMYRYLADAGWFTECSTGQRLAVAAEQDNAALEAAYSKARSKPGQELLVSLEGKIMQKPKMEGEGTQTTLVVEHFLGVWRGETCGSRTSTAPLENTYWKLTRLGDEPVIVKEGVREPNIVLHSQDHHVAGSGGCNRLVGNYHLNGDSLTLSNVASTMMACIHGMEIEHAFAMTLAKVKTWEIFGQHLELYGEDGKLLARFEARAMK